MFDYQRFSRERNQYFFQSSKNENLEIVDILTAPYLIFLTNKSKHSCHVNRFLF